MQLVNAFKSAAKGYGTERRVLLLHGPVGSSKSTIARLLKRGLEDYAAHRPGHGLQLLLEDARRLLARSARCTRSRCTWSRKDLRPALLDRLNADRKAGDYEVSIRGELCPFCRQMYNERLAEYDGDWHEMLKEIKVYRLLLSEQDRIGIGTFQPKDEKNQDSTELTGDINYRKIAEYGTDSDPRAFNFDGELNIANRGLVEFIEVLKLDVAFLYDLLGASQEHKIKPKKFAQTDIDEVILGHSVSGPTPIPYRIDGVAGWTTLEKLHERFVNDPDGLEVLAHDFADGPDHLDGGARSVPPSLQRQAADHLAKVGRGRDDAEPLDLRPQRPDVLPRGKTGSHGRSRPVRAVLHRRSRNHRRCRRDRRLCARRGACHQRRAGS